jgi:hypothetical protein
MYPLNFTETDLEANRRGMLSAAQKRQLRRDLIGYLVMMAILMTIGILVVFAGGRLMQGEFLFAFPSVSESVLLIIATVVFGFVVFKDTRGVRGDLASGKVEAIEGIAQYHVEHFLRIRVRELTITKADGKVVALSIHPSVLQQFTPGECYRVYYMAESGRIASAEMVSAE